MKNNRGFVFIETIITIVIVSTTLVLLYATYAKSVSEEKKRLYYDDIAYIFKTETIKNVLDKSLNFDTFKNNYNNSGIYGYLFQYGSPTYNDNTKIKDANDLLNFSVLYYLKYEDISNLKDCINNQKTGTKCQKTLSMLENYGSGTEFKKYLTTIDVKQQNNYGILIAMYSEMKNGDSIGTNTNYKECINSKAYEHYEDETTNTTKALELYYKDTSVNFNMSCEKAYYFAWVYGWNI